MKKITIIYLVLISLFASCKRDIELYNTDDFEPELVVNSTLVNDQYIYVLVSKTGVPLQLDSTIFIKDAIVEIYENDILKETLPFYEMYSDTLDRSFYNHTPHYKSSFKINSENTYTVVVKAMNKTVTKDVIFPAEATNTEVEFSDLYLQDTFNLENGYMYCQFSFSSRITINDNDGKDYYFIALYSKNYSFDFDTITFEYGDTITDTSLYYTSVYDDNELVDIQSVWCNFVIDQTSIGGKIYNDVLFSGQSYNINSGDGYLGTTIEVGEAVKIYYQTFTLSEDLFKYFVSEQKNYSSIGNPFVEPVNIYSNLNNALGIISGINSTVDSVIIPVEDFIFVSYDDDDD